METAAPTRRERDSMGEFEVPADAYYGANTMRAVVNFPISDLRLGRRFIHAIGLIKQQSAEVNRELGLLDAGLAGAIVRAAQDVVDGGLDDQFVVDVFQTGSGTSTNMNANEVVSNRAIELLSGVKGSRTPVHPNDHVNLGQSSNDVIPTAIHVAAATAINEELLPALQVLEASLRRKSEQFWGVVKTGRTHLQDATPIRLGQEFLGYAGQVERGRRRAAAALGELQELALGGTAVGTGVNTHPEFAGRVIARLSERTGLPFTETDNHFQAQATLDNAVAAAGQLKAVAVSLYKVASDIRLLGCGPRAGLAEIAVPAVQPGSSIMPGKVNPVLCEAVRQVCAQVYGNDAAVAFAGAVGNFELNVMLPVMGRNLLESIRLLSSVSVVFADKCVAGIEADEERCRTYALSSPSISAALNPYIGYEEVAKVLKASVAEGKDLRTIVLERGLLTEDEVDRALDVEAMTRGGIIG